MSCYRLFISVLFILCLFLLSNTQPEERTKRDTSEIRFENYRNQDSLADWISYQKDIYNKEYPNKDYNWEIDFVNSVQESLWRAPQSDIECEKWAAFLSNRASAKNGLGDFVGAKNDFVESLAMFHSVDDKVRDEIVWYVYYPLANIYTRHGENEQAIGLLRTYIDRAISNEDFQRVGKGYSDLATALKNRGDYEQALEMYLEGIDFAKGSNEALGLLSINAADLYIEKERFREAEELALKAINYVVSTQDEEYIGGANQTLGKLYSATGDFAKAQAYFEQAKESYMRIFPNGIHRVLGKLYLEIGDMRRKQGQYEDALNYFQDALVSVLPSFKARSLNSLPEQDQMYSEVVIGEVILKKVEVYLELAEKSAQTREEYLEEAIHHYNSYFQMEGLYRQQFVAAGSKLKFVEEVHGHAEEAIETAMKLYQKTGKESWLEQCVLFSEQTKGIMLSESVDPRILQERGAFPKKVIELLELQSQHEYIQTVIRKNRFDETDKEKFDSLVSLEQSINAEVLSCASDLENEFPTLHRELFESNQLTIEDIRNFRKGGPSNVLTYYYGERNIYCFGLNQNTIQFRKVKVTEELKQLFEQFMVELTSPLNSTCSRYSELASSIYHKLFKPFENAFVGESVVVIPDGSLIQVPFEALCENQGTEFSDLNYLVNKHSVSYAYSLKQLNREFSPIEYAKNFLGFAPLFKDSKNHNPLPFSRNEVNSGVQLGGDTLVDDEAKKSQFVSEARKYRILHLSTHAEMWNPEFEQASIAFYEENDPKKDYLLASELSTLQVSPELLVLSACETGKGDVIMGEGMLSLSRIFAQSGTKNIIASLWKVDHQPNSRMLTDFYERLNENRDLSIGDALTYSKREYLKENKFKEAQAAHPYYWSGMILMGNNELNLENPSSGLNWFWLLLLTPVVIVIIVRFRARRAVRK